MATVVSDNRRRAAIPASVRRPSGLSKSAVIAVALALGVSALGVMPSTIRASTTFPGTLPSGKTLFPGDSVTSLSNPYRLTMRADGNLVLDVCGRVLWASRTSNNAGARAVMQADGNLVVKSTANVILWQTYSANHPYAYLAVQRDGNLVVYDQNGPPKYYWTSKTVAGYTPICGAWTLFGGNSVVSPNGKFHLDMQTGGNLVLYPTGSTNEVWTSWTMKHPGAQATIVKGQLVVELNGSALYTSPSPTSASAYLAVTDYGNVDLISLKGTTLWRAAGLPKVTSTTSDGLPSWWNHLTCPLFGVNTTPLKTWSATGLIACGPGTTRDSTQFSPTPVQVTKWQCVELSERWLYQEFQLPQQIAMGNAVAPHYEAYMVKNPGSRHHLVYETPASPGAGIGPGDVMSYTDGGKYGHTAVVYQVTDTTYTILSENWANGIGDPTYKLALVNGIPQAWPGFAVVGWLHDTE